MADQPNIVRVRTADLARILRAVLPMVDREPGTSMHGVFIETGGGVITATATNRFILGHARAQCEGVLNRPVVVWRKGMRRFIRALADENHTAHSLLSVQRTATKDTVLILGSDETGDGPNPSPLDLWDDNGFEWVAEAPCEESGITGGSARLGFPDYVKIFEQQGGRRSPMAGPFSVNPRLLRLFEPATREPGGDFVSPPRFRPGVRPGSRRGIAAAIRVDIGDWFAGLVMPCALSAEDYDALVPVGLPPATVEAVASDG